MKVLECNAMCNEAAFYLAQCLSECRLKPFPSSPGRKALVIARPLCNITADLRKESQLPAHPFSSRTFAQNCSSESAMDGSRSYSPHRRSHSSRWAIGAGSASGLRIEPANSSASSSRSRSLNCSKLGISAARMHKCIVPLLSSSMLKAVGPSFCSRSNQVLKSLNNHICCSIEWSRLSFQSFAVALMTAFQKRFTVITVPGVFLCSFLLLAQDTPPADVQRKPILIAKIDRKTPVDFEKEILPILKNNCLACHNKTTTKADLILETPQDILKGSESGKVVVPKRSGESLLLKIASHQVKPMMPPKNNKVQAADLTPEELGLIKLWIDQGAKGEVHGSGPIVWQPLPEGLNPIYAVALTSDGQFAACARANQIFIYHIPSKQLVTRLTDAQLLKAGVYGKLGVAHRDLVHSLAFSPDGNVLVSGGYREAKLWRRPKDVQKFNLSSIARQAVLAVAVSPDGKWLATGGDDGSIRLWNPATGKSVRKLSGHKRAVNGLNFSPDSSKLVSGSVDKTIRVWDVAKGKVLCQTQTATEVNAVAWVSDGRQIASGGADYLIRLWYVDVVKRELAALKEIKGHEGPVTSLATVPPNGAQVISGSGDGTIRQWNLEDGQLIRKMKHGGPVAAVAARNDGKRFASAGLNNIAKLWDASEGKEITELRGDRYAREFQGATERESVFATNEVSFRKSALQTATNNHKAQLDRVKKANETLAAAEKTYAEKKTNVLNAAEAKAAAEKVLAEFAEIRKASDAHEAADKASTQAAAELKTAREKPSPDKALVDKLVAEADVKAKAAAETKAVLDKLPAEAKEKYKPANEK